MALLRSSTSNCANRVNIAAKVFAEYGDFIHAVIRYKVKNEAQANDLFQDFFLSIVSTSVPIGVQNIKSYLYKAIINDIVDAARRVEKYQARIHRYAELRKYSKTAYSPENALIEAEEIDKMFRLIERRLLRHEAKAILLQYRNHFETKKVAAEMGVNSESVHKYVYRGLKKIRQFLKENS